MSAETKAFGRQLQKQAAPEFFRPKTPVTEQIVKTYTDHPSAVGVLVKKIQSLFSHRLDRAALAALLQFKVLALYAPLDCYSKLVKSLKPVIVANNRKYAEAKQAVGKAQMASQFESHFYADFQIYTSARVALTCLHLAGSYLAGGQSPQSAEKMFMDYYGAREFLVWICGRLNRDYHLPKDLESQPLVLMVNTLNYLRAPYAAEQSTGLLTSAAVRKAGRQALRKSAFSSTANLTDN